MRKLTDAQIAEIRQMHKAGCPQVQIAARLRVNVCSVQYLIRINPHKPGRHSTADFERFWQRMNAKALAGKA